MGSHAQPFQFAPAVAPNATELEHMRVIRDMVAKGALSMVDEANHKPANRALKPKVGGHQASSMSSVDLLMALYLHALRPGDRLAVKPHAAPVLYALMHAMGLLSRAQMSRLREYKGPQPYPTELKNPAFVDYTTSSEGLGVACTIYDAYGAKHFDRALAGALGKPPITATYWAHCGDGELTEGQIDESLYDAGRWQLDNLVWIVDLNRQSLDRVMDDSGQLARWVRGKFASQGWDVVELRWGSRAEALFQRPGGAALKSWLEALDDALFHPLLLIGDAGLRALLTGGAAATPALQRLFELFRCARADVGRDAGGHRDLVARTRPRPRAGARPPRRPRPGGACDRVRRRAHCATRPSVIIAHTVKGYETSGAAHPENHGGLLPMAEVQSLGRRSRACRATSPIRCRNPAARRRRFLARKLRAVRRSRPSPPRWRRSTPRPELAKVAFRPAHRSCRPARPSRASTSPVMKTALGPYLQFGAPDVGQTTHLGPIIKQTGVFAPRDLPDVYGFMRESGALSFDWRPTKTGQFHAFGIAEGNAMLWAYAFGRKKKAIEGKVPLLPIVTVYDKFFERGFNQLDYAVYSNARFIAVGTPSGTGLSRETATHQSIQTLRMMMDLPGILSYEPAFAADLHAIYLHALGQLWAPEGEAFYLRLTTQPLEQPTHAAADDHADALAVRGAYWLIGEDERARRRQQGACSSPRGASSKRCARPRASCTQRASARAS